MPIDFDHELLRRKREGVEPNLTKYAKAVGIAKGTVSKIETGYGVREKTLEKYLAGMGLGIDDVKLAWNFKFLSPPSLKLPKSVNFRPIYWPNPYSDNWRDQSFGIVPLGLVIFGGENSSRVESIQITLEELPELGLPKMDFHWLYWVRLDNAPRDEHPDPNTQWRGEYDAFGEGATVSSRELSVGQQLSKEIFFKSENAVSWRDLSATFIDDDFEKYEDLLLKFQIEVEWFERRGTRIISESFTVPAKCLHTGFKATSRNDLKLAKFLQVRTVEGGKYACALNCC
jgi:transcriptional regulator with XRE-family HTH domain